MIPVRTNTQVAAAEFPASPPPHADFLGLPFCLLSQQQVVRLILAAPGAPFRYVVTPNAYHVVAVHDDPARLLPIYRRAWLSLCDSRILRALAKLDGRALPLVTGSDLAAALLCALERVDRPQRVLVVGPSRTAVAALRAAHPALTFDVMPAPAGLAGDAGLRLAVARGCMARSWDILLLCVGCPAQELIACQLADLGCTSGVALCVGAAIDFLTGASVRAPLWVQKLSLEWAYRLAQEPQRLWRRYLVESPRILRIFLLAHWPYRR
jgi:exopolysaccharide biosynthesis WecB/TagA/CpsF family protein